MFPCKRLSGMGLAGPGSELQRNFMVSQATTIDPGDGADRAAKDGDGMSESDFIGGKKCTTSGKPPEPGFEDSGAPAPINPATGQHESYWILCDEERAKGFIRPVRMSYKHVGLRPKYPIRELTPAEHKDYDQ